jgi:uncharacterized membrane protein YgcG
VWPIGSWAQAGWEIEEFEAVIAIERDGSIAVRETVRADFGLLEKHGIFRDIPVTYQKISGGYTYTRVFDVEVLQDGTQAEVDVTRNDANMRLRIGEPDETISGRHEYVISYRVLGVLQAFDGFDELNWNVTGNEWEAPIIRARAIVTTPVDIVQVACYEGFSGSTTACEEASHENGEAQFTTTSLEPREGLTVAVGYAPGVIPIVTIDAPLSPLDVVFSPVTLAVGAAVFLVGTVWIIGRWWRYGRDRYWQRAHLPGVRSDRDGKTVPEKVLPLFFRQPVSVEYDPPDGLRPAEMGVLMDERADTLDVSATIVDLAARGYLMITEVPKKWLFGKVDYTFVRTEKSDGDLLPYERELLKRLFGGSKEVALSSLKNTFHDDLAYVKELLYEEVTNKGLFGALPNKVRQWAVVKSIGIGVLGGAMAGLAFWWLGKLEALHPGQHVLAGVGIALIGMGIVSLFVSRHMPHKTGYGRELYARTLGYELFVSGTEKHRAKFYENEGLFVQVLPYAIMFGVTEKLARAFREMGIQPPQPTWFHSAAHFNAAHFASSMNSFSDSLSSVMASSPSSSGSGGGGSSGSGFGGGGGGSW